MMGEPKVNEEIRNMLLQKNFEITKVVYTTPILSRNPSIFMDGNHQQWAVCKNKKIEPRIYNYSDIVNFEIYENNGNKTKGRAGGAVVGGVLLGPLGALAGASIGKNQVTTCTEMSVLITINDVNNPTIKINLIFAQTKSNSLVYKTAIQTAQTIIGYFDYMKDLAKKSETPEAKEAISAADEIKKFKVLLDDGILTQEEFNAKKKQLLGV